MHDQKDFKFEIKAVDGEGIFSGLAASYDTVDAGDDLIERGAFTKTLKDQGDTRPLLWQHANDKPIGTISLTDTPEGLRCSGKLLLAVDDARKAYALMKAGIVKGLSIGYQSVDATYRGAVRVLKEIKLFEVSLVTFPMNDAAIVTAVKDRAGNEDAALRLIAEMRSDVRRLTG